MNEDERRLPLSLDGFDDLSVRLRELAFSEIATTGEAVAPAMLAALSRENIGAVEAALRRLAEAGRVDRDSEGRVVGSAGLTVAEGPHQLAFGGRTFKTWCAFDALGIPASLAVDAAVETACAVCGAPIRVAVRAGEPIVPNEARLWMSAGGVDLRADFCAPTVLLCSDAHAQSWGETHNGAGEVLSVTEAAEVGARNWASCAAALAELNSRH